MNTSLMMETREEILKKVYTKTLRNFIDFIIMGKLANKEMSGYDVLDCIHNEYDVMISPGTIYAILYSLERDDLIKGQKVENKRTYTLTNKGENIIQVLSNSTEHLQNLTLKLLQAK